jgi:hypothetical protein
MSSKSRCCRTNIASMLEVWSAPEHLYHDARWRFI